jgi:isocitrate/isopropylmalate dehydrogenase
MIGSAPDIAGKGIASPIGDTVPARWPGSAKP